MSTLSKPMSAIQLVERLAGEHLIDPALLVETIKDNAGLWAAVKSYGKGIATYEHVSETLARYI